MMTVPNRTTQHVDFNDWLEQCPVEWFKSPRPTASATVSYEFFFDPIPDDDQDSL